MLECRVRSQSGIRDKHPRCCSAEHRRLCLVVVVVIAAAPSALCRVSAGPFLVDSENIEYSDGAGIPCISCRSQRRWNNYDMYI